MPICSDRGFARLVVAASNIDPSSGRWLVPRATSLLPGSHPTGANRLSAPSSVPMAAATPTRRCRSWRTARWMRSRPPTRRCLTGAPATAAAPWNSRGGSKPRSRSSRNAAARRRSILPPILPSSGCHWNSMIGTTRSPPATSTTPSTCKRHRDSAGSARHRTRPGGILAATWWHAAWPGKRSTTTTTPSGTCASRSSNTGYSPKTRTTSRRFRPYGARSGLSVPGSTPTR